MPAISDGEREGDEGGRGDGGAEEGGGKGGGSAQPALLTLQSVSASSSVSSSQLYL